MSPLDTVDGLGDLIDAVVYGDVFDCAVTFDELWRYSLVPIDRDDLQRRLADRPLRDVVTSRDGFYVLCGREALAERRAFRRAHAEVLRRRARRVARLLQHFPFVRGLLLTGSVAADDAAEGADVDLLVIVRHRRLAFAFAMLAPLSRLVSRDVFCPNYYLSDAHLTMTRQNHYVARELMQAEPLAGSAAAIFSANAWVDALLPNAAPRGDRLSPMPLGRWLQWLVELPLRGTIGDRLDRRAHDLALRRLTVHHAGFGDRPPQSVTRDFDAGVELRFHGGALVDRTTDRYMRRRAEVRDLLATALDGGAPSRSVSP